MSRKQTLSLRGAFGDEAILATQPKIAAVRHDAFPRKDRGRTYPFGVFLLFCSVIFLGVGCAKKNDTPFVLPTNQPPVPIGQNTNVGLEPTIGLRVFLVALENTDAWKAAGTNDATIGCNDRLIPYQFVAKGDATDSSDRLRQALTGLFALPADNGGLSNILAKGNLAVGTITGSAASGTVDITGQLNSGGVCDDPRIRAQVEKTVAAYGKYAISLNGSVSAWRCFGDMSGECK
ncbi:hypothetical protein KBD18_00010 [Patescibacteria group bacterium]|nr:hypothetical protein [Patescibacteria group bacterium]